MAYNPDDPMAGGPSGYYNPEFGLLAIQNPEAFVQHLARNGVQPPEDFPEDFNHQDAHQVLGRQLKDQSRAPSNFVPQVGNFDERFNDAFGSGKQSNDPLAFTAPSRAGGFGRPPGSTDTLNPKFPGQGAPGDTEPVQQSESPGESPPPNPFIDPNFKPSMGRNANPNEAGPPQQGFVPPSASQRPGFGQFINPVRPGVGFPSSIPGPRPPEPPAPHNEEPTRDIPLPRSRPERASEAEPWGGRPHVDPEPIAASDTTSTAGGASVPAGTSKEQTGDLNQKEPTAKTEVNKEGKKDKENSWDTFGKALAGVSALKPPPVVFPHPGNLPHPSNQISRSTVPTELLKEMSSIGRPGTLLRLGQALKGR